MADEKQLKQAKAAYKSLCDMLDERELIYTKNEEEFRIECGMQGDDLPIEIRIAVDPERQLVILLSSMPFTVAENRRTAMAIAVSCANNGLVDGNFDYDYLSGGIAFRMTSSFMESLVGKEMFEYMLACAAYTVDAYNDKFFAVSKQEMTLEEIVAYIG